MKNKKLNVGVIGLGVGEKHLEAYLKNKHCKVVGICDFDKNKLKTLSRKYPLIFATKNADQILENPDIGIVSIASYDNFHHKQIIRAINNDKHIFVEKPLCLYAQEARDIKKCLAQKPHLKLSSNLILRQSPRFEWLKKVIQEGTLGTIYHIEGDYNYGRLEKITHGWRGAIDFYSVIYGGGVHVIDLMLWLTKDKPVKVAAFGNNLSSRRSQFRYNDVVTGIIQFQSGMTAKVTSNYSCVHPHFHNFAVYGTKGTFVNGLNHGLFFNSRNPNIKPQKITAAYPGVHKGDLINDFIEAIRLRREPKVSKKDIFQVMDVCFAMEQALKKGVVRLR